MYIEAFQAWLQEEGTGELTQQEYLRVVKILARWRETSTGKPFDPGDRSGSSRLDQPYANGGALGPVVNQQTDCRDKDVLGCG
ncbi:hypothetical protein GCM10011571_35480 [Marinithermofilum abyssi]|jgi:hypothetical protein|uniref:Uncharacterized protein n=1 Tax=Marinithermofilum abyssi TaxID=1571185 RepID=A0A8J2VLT6_9BACL|nr:hypothetical protein [Marinithermofilum abyssi]GGE30176.1 hypothetical protein GCM10011571_35480 [Marinithermofilum abyssi]